MKTIEFQTKVENGMIKIPKQYKLPDHKVKIAIFEKEPSEKDILFVEIDNQLKNFFTLSAIQSYIEKQLQFLLMDQIKSTIDKNLTEDRINNDLLLEKSREQAWESYKDFFLEGVNKD